MQNFYAKNSDISISYNLQKKKLNTNKSKIHFFNVQVEHAAKSSSLEWESQL